MTHAVAIDFGHGPGSSSTRVLGACTYAEGKPRTVKAVRHHERDLILRYGFTLAQLFASKGVAVRCLYEGGYATRQKQADGADLYLALHVNAGGGNYAATMHDLHDDAAKRAAGSILFELESLGEIERGIRGVFDPTKTEGTRVNGGIVFANGFDLLRFTPEEVPAVLVEPFFIDQPDHSTLRSQAGLERVASAVFRGAIKWLEQR